MSYAIETHNLTKIYTRDQRGKRSPFYALRDTSFSIAQGSICGIIGPNGAGKSTLLKILSCVIPPSDGSLAVRGVLSSLLELGVGFHPELSGRENIFLSGSLIGMRRRDIASVFDSIVSFADIGPFLDTPVKYYSTGMYMRLAFAVSSHLSSDILLIDEVLSVGDTPFQEKSLRKMKEITSVSGRTIILVSHDLAFIEKYCTQCLFFCEGNLVYQGTPREAVRAYKEYIFSSASSLPVVRPELSHHDAARLSSWHVNTEGSHVCITGESALFVFRFQLFRRLSQGTVSLSLFSSDGRLLWTSAAKIGEGAAEEGTYEMRFLLADFPFAEGTYAPYISINSIIDGISDAWYPSPALCVTTPESKSNGVSTEWRGAVVLPTTFEVVKVSNGE